MDTINLDHAFSQIYVLMVVLQETSDSHKNIRMHPLGTINNHGKFYGNILFVFLQGTCQTANISTVTPCQNRLNKQYRCHQIKNK